MIESIPYVLTGIGIIISILYYTSVLRNANKTQQIQLETRQANLFNSIYQTLLREDLFKVMFELHNEYQYTDHDDFIEKYGPDTNPEAYTKWHRYMAHLEGIGIYVQRELVNPELIDDFMSGDIIGYWEKFEPYIVEARKRRNYPQYFEHIEYLYNQVKSIRDEQHPELQTKETIIIDKLNR